MNDQPTSAENDQPIGQPPDNPAKKKPFQFGLKHLFLLTTAAALPCAFATWIWNIMHDVGLTVVAGMWSSGSVIAIGFLIHGIMHKRTGEVVFGSIAIALLFVVCCLPPAISSSPEAANRAKCLNNLKKIGWALQLYHADYGSFPPAYIADENGTPMHSWRVLILPYLNEQDLYDQYDFNEPWDGPNNSKLGKTILNVYCCPSDPWPFRDTTTNHVAVIGKNTMWPGTAARKLSEVTDGTRNAIAVVEVINSGIHWMEPRDLDFQQMMFQINPKTGKGMSSHHREGASVVYADGSTHYLSDTLKGKKIKALLTIDGGEKVQ